MILQFDIDSWGLFCGHRGRQLVLIDDTPCGPVSARKKMVKTVPRRLLLDEERIAHVFCSSQPVSQTVIFGGERWQVEIRPLFSPYSAAVVGVMAGVFSEGQPIPEPLPIGCWEWIIDRKPNGQPSTNRKTYWDRKLFDIYQVSTEAAQSHPGYWDTSEWANEMIYQADQMRVNSLIRDGIQEGLDGVTATLRCLTYDIVTGYGSDTKGREHLRLVGQILPIEATDDQIIIQGFSHVVPEDYHDIAFERNADAGRVDDVLRGVMELADQPMAVVDVMTLEVLMSSPSWRDADFNIVEGLANFSSRGEQALHDFVIAASRNTDKSQTAPVCFEGSDGTQHPAQMTVLGVVDSHQSHDALIKLSL